MDNKSYPKKTISHVEKNYKNYINNILLDKFARCFNLDLHHANKNDSQFEDYQSHKKFLSPNQLRTESHIENNKNSSIFQISGILSNQEKIKTVTFEYTTSYKAGLLFANINNKSLAMLAPNEDLYAPFGDKHDYSMAKCMDRHEITKGAIVNYFNNSDISLFWKFNNFTSTDSLQEKMRLMNNGIKADKWHIQGLSVNFMVDSIEFAKYTIFYRNITKSLQFFVGHKRFKQDLVYNPICQYTLNLLLNPNIKNDNERLYKEINTGNWW